MFINVNFFFNMSFPTLSGNLSPFNFLKNKIWTRSPFPPTPLVVADKQSRLSVEAKSVDWRDDNTLYLKINNL
jgi:hypothetical protein